MKPRITREEWEEHLTQHDGYCPYGYLVGTQQIHWYLHDIRGDIVEGRLNLEDLNFKREDSSGEL